ncbi:MAG: hypothetical protein ACRDN9_19960, partial [Streptosporangiaceae bacterium]
MQVRPRRRLRALLAVVLALSLSCAMTSPSSADDKDGLKHKKHKVQGRINGAQSDLDQSSSRLTKAAHALKHAEGKLSTAKGVLTKTRGQLAAARARDAQMQAKLVEAQNTLTKAKASLKTGKKDLRKSKRRVRRFTLERLQNGDPGLRAFGDLMDGADPMEFSEQMSINDSIGDAQLANMEEFDASKVMLELNKEKVTRLRDEVARQRAAAAENLERQKKLEAAAEKQTAKVAVLVDNTAAAKSEAASAKAEDLAHLNELESERNRIGKKLKAIAAREAAKARKRHRAAASSGGGGGGSSSGGGGGGGGGGGVFSY